METKMNGGRTLQKLKLYFKKNVEKNLSFWCFDFIVAFFQGEMYFIRGVGCFMDKNLEVSYGAKNPWSQ
jgi:hypothetical protein